MVWDCNVVGWNGFGFIGRGVVVVWLIKMKLRVARKVLRAKIGKGG